MNFEDLLSCLYRHRADIAQKLDPGSRKELAAHIRDALKTKTVSKPFFTFCGSNLFKFVGGSCDRFFPGDEKDITPSNAETYGNAVIEALESPPETHEPSESEADK